MKFNKNTILIAILAIIVIGLLVRVINRNEHNLKTQKNPVIFSEQLTHNRIDKITTSSENSNKMIINTLVNNQENYTEIFKTFVKDIKVSKKTNNQKYRYYKTETEGILISFREYKNTLELEFYIFREEPYDLFFISSIMFKEDTRTIDVKNVEFLEVNKILINNMIELIKEDLKIKLKQEKING